jgi:hypothetical protein
MFTLVIKLFAVNQIELLPVDIGDEAWSGLLALKEDIIDSKLTDGLNIIKIKLKFPASLCNY